MAIMYLLVFVLFVSLEYYAHEYKSFLLQPSVAVVAEALYSFIPYILIC